ncbi:MAG: hypothetical protein MMC33_009876 [Icmadophila ericetorum]|nr:hypothetical protein [Icmadophila ericetorum]
MCRTPIDLILIDRIAAHNGRSPAQKLYAEGDTSITTLYGADDAHRKIISGIADYVLGYKDHTSTFNICNSFVAIDAKKCDTLDLAVPQCSAYMAGIQQQHEHVDKSIQVVYGAVTDGIQWIFMRLDSEHQLSRSTSLSMLTQKSQIFTFLDAILYAAASSSPATGRRKNVAGQPERFDNPHQFTVAVEEPRFRNLTGLPDNWKDFLIGVDDEDEEGGGAEGDSLSTPMPP